MYRLSICRGEDQGNSAQQQSNQKLEQNVEETQHQLHGERPFLILFPEEEKKDEQDDTNNKEVKEKA